MCIKVAELNLNTEHINWHLLIFIVIIFHLMMCLIYYKNTAHTGFFSLTNYSAEIRLNKVDQRKRKHSCLKGKMMCLESN